MVFGAKRRAATAEDVDDPGIRRWAVPPPAGTYRQTGPPSTRANDISSVATGPAYAEFGNHWAPAFFGFARPFGAGLVAARPPCLHAPRRRPFSLVWPSTTHLLAGT